MNQNELMTGVTAGTITVNSITTRDFKTLCLSQDTLPYAVLLIGKDYFTKSSQMICEKMMKINLNSEKNQAIIQQTSNVVTMGRHGEININVAGCAIAFNHYLSQAMLNKPQSAPQSIFQSIIEFFNIIKKIKEILLYRKISKAADRLKRKFITCNVSSKHSLPGNMKRGWDELEKWLRSEEFRAELDDLDYYESVEEFLEMSVSNIGSLNSIFSEFENDLKPLKELIDKRDHL